MEFTESYVSGFCKAAESCGIDPVYLCKAAGVPLRFLIKNLPKTVMTARSAVTASPGVMGQLRNIVRGGVAGAGHARAAIADNVKANLMARLDTIGAARRTLSGAYPTGVPSQYEAELSRLEGPTKEHLKRLAGIFPKESVKLNYGPESTPQTRAADVIGWYGLTPQQRMNKTLQQRLGGTKSLSLRKIPDAFNRAVDGAIASPMQ